MNIQILQLIEGAKKATGLAVIIDVFRAFSVESYFFGQGAEKIIPVGDSALAYQLKEANPQYILAGERHGKILPGFDAGNAPSDVVRMNCLGKTVVHTTSAGTQGIMHATHADEILGGSLVNAKATANYIKKSGATDISLVCMGWEGTEPTEEDTLCAEYIKSLLLDTTFDLEAGIAHVKKTSGAKFFDAKQNDVFPRKDFFLCTDYDRFDFVLKLIKEEGELPYMKKTEL